MALVKVNRAIVEAVFCEHSKEDTVCDNFYPAADVDLCVLCYDRKIIGEIGVQSGERVVQRIAGSSRRLADYDVAISGKQVEFMDRSYRTLAGPHIAKDYEMVIEIDRVDHRKYREIGERLQRLVADFGIRKAARHPEKRQAPVNRICGM